MKEVIISPKAIEELDEHITQVQDGLAIICNGNTHVAIENGHFAYVKNHPDLPDGLYQAKAAIAANEALSTSNLTADPSGGLNKLKEDVNALNSNLKNQTIFHGHVNITLSGSVESIEGSVSFPTSFISNPDVVLTLSDTARGSASGSPKTSAMVLAISSTGFNYRIKTDAVTGGTVILYWIAAGSLP